MIVKRVKKGLYHCELNSSLALMQKAWLPFTNVKLVYYSWLCWIKVWLRTGVDLNFKGPNRFLLKYYNPLSSIKMLWKFYPISDSKALVSCNYLKTFDFISSLFSLCSTSDNHPFLCYHSLAIGLLLCWASDANNILLTQQ
jgi:hypothetical protein